MKNLSEEFSLYFDPSVEDSFRMTTLILRSQSLSQDDKIPEGRAVIIPDKTGLTL